MKTYHLLGSAPYFTNCYMITDENSNAVLIDCSADVEKVKKILENDRAQLKAILLTHGHEDHRETLEQTKSAFDCPVYLSQADADFFGITDTVDFDDGTLLSFGNIKITAFSTPGHTPGGYCFICEDMLFSGDTLFAGTVGRTDMPGGNYELLMVSMKKILETVQTNLKVLPGHNHFSNMDMEKQQNPYLKNIKI